jgi:predicted  nucleic acid-binding Zn-ribbon protein
MYNFYHINESIKPKQAALEQANVDLTLKHQKMRETEEAYNKILEEIAVLQSKFDKINAKKVKLEE